MLAAVEIRRLTPQDAELVKQAADLFDGPPRPEATRRFLSEPTHHLLMALLDGEPLGFVSGVETTHPDKGTEMLLYELLVAEPHRRRGIGRALVEALARCARHRGCYGMFGLADDGNTAARRTYASAGASRPTRRLMYDWSLEPRD